MKTCHAYENVELINYVTNGEQIVSFGSLIGDTKQIDILNSLYEKPIKSTRTGSIFNSHSYPTKINSNAIVPFIMAHTKPGDLVFDGFSGSGAAGVAASLCENPSPELKKSVESVISSNINWGTRNAILYDVSELATFISGSILQPPDIKRFNRAANELVSNLESKWGWLYEVQKDKDTPGTIRYNIWSDYPVCPHCGNSSTFWDVAVSAKPLYIASKITCRYCSKQYDVSSADRLVEELQDELLSKKIERRLRCPVYVYGKTGKTLWKRQANDKDIELIERIENTPLPGKIPIVELKREKGERWGELYRSGYHHGITHIHHFYTRRNLIAIAAAWNLAEEYPENIRKALQFWISSYNASHSTLMTRVVCKKGAKDLVCTSTQSATLYISSLPVEKNVFLGLKNKLKMVTSAYLAFQNRTNKVSVNCASSLNVALPDSSVDYIFTDPPFGENIQYSEVNLISEAWLGKITNREEEVIVSSYQNKSIDEYRLLLTKSFVEAFRILKPGHYMTVIFHSTKPEVWNALYAAWQNAGFTMVRSSILDKVQASFKQTTTKGSVKGDPVILLQKPHIVNKVAGNFSVSDKPAQDPWEIINLRLSTLNENDSECRNKQRLYSYLITYYLEKGYPISMNAKEFFRGLEERYKCINNAYYLN